MIIIGKTIEETHRKKHEAEWIALIMIAKQIGLTPDEVRKFIKEHKQLT